MKTIERNILRMAAGAMVLVAATYLARFISFPISEEPTHWGAIGDYFGGILAPILSFLLVWLVIREGADSRANFLESKQLQIKSQEQINTQIELLTPKPEMVYYPLAVGNTIIAVVENIGNAIAYNLRIEFHFDKQVSKYIQESALRLSNPNYFPPKYKMSFWAGHIALDRKPTDIPAHSVKIRWSDAPTEPINREHIFVLDDLMLMSLHSEPDYKGMLSDLANKIARS